MIMFGRKDLKMFRRKVREDDQIMCEWGFIRICTGWH